MRRADPIKRYSYMNTKLNQMRHWVDRIVVGLELCPFAAVPHRTETIRYASSESTEPHEILADLLHELSLLDEPGSARTTLLVITAALIDFDDYLDLFAAAEDLIERTGHAERFQLVSFHPDYRFEGLSPDDPANHTNRSPSPTIHILRRTDVAQAIASHEDVGSIPEDNIRRLRTLGSESLARLLSE
ncbi:MAG: hypothetical protein ACI8RZ_006619 [Myxococcota bacterium]|jgi:hypothetical protein